MSERQTRVDYENQCDTFAPNSAERCSLCANHPGEHKFPVTKERDQYLEALVVVAQQRGDLLAALKRILAHCGAHRDAAVDAHWVAQQCQTAIEQAADRRLAPPPLPPGIGGEAE